MPVRRSTRATEPSVLHFMQQWLPLSEPFVYNLVTKTSTPGVVVSGDAPENVDLFPYQPLYSLGRIPHVNPLRRYGVTASLMFLARRHGGRIVHVHHGYRSHEVMGVVRRLELPYVLSLHGHDITGSVEAHPDRYDAASKVVDAVIVPSNFLAGIAVAAGFPEDRVHVIPTGVDTTVFTPTPLPDGTPVALFVGRFVEKKGLDVLLAAWPTVRNQVPTARLRLLGFGPLEQLARAGGEGVEVVLRPNQEQVRQAIRQAHVVVSPSRTAVGDSVESLLVVNLEGQASGRPVVTTRHGGIPEFVVDGETALVVPENDPAALAAAVIKVLTDRPLAERLAAAGPAWASRFDARRCAARVDDLYGSLLSSPRRRVITSR